MPKTTGTRKQKAMELIEILKEGPSFTPLDSFNVIEDRRLFNLWCESWIIPELKEKI